MLRDSRWLVALCAVFLTGCAGSLTYIRPTTDPRVDNVKVIERPRDAVWNSAVSNLGKQFFVINNMDRSSGFINLSYSGDPESYVDCGRITSKVSNLAGSRTYDFPGAQANSTYEIMNTSLYGVRRTMELEGRANLVFEELSPTQTRVTVTVRYVLTRTLQITPVGGTPRESRDVINFNTGGGSAFPMYGTAPVTECVASGKLERDILGAIN